MSSFSTFSISKSNTLHAGSAGWLHALFPVMVFAEKSKYTEERQEKSALHHRKLEFTKCALMVLVESP
jgi:hypothetical protein